MRQLRNELERCHPRFYHLANIVIEHKLSDLLAELTEDDPWIDQASQLTLLHFAAANGFNETIAYFLQQGVPINAPDKHGNTPLHYASLCGNEAGAKYLLEHGANKSISNQRGQHPWHVAYNRTLLALLYKGEGQAPAKSLYEAVLDEHVATVELLLQQGVQPNLLNHGDYQVELQLPLHLAVETKNLAIVNLLLQHGANPNYPYTSVHVPLETAIKQQNTKMVALLLHYGANPNHRIRHSLLHLAVERDLLDVIELLLQHGADPEVQVSGHYFYHPPLREACSKEAIQLLIDYGAETDPEKMRDFLIWPIGRGDLATVQAFIDIGVPVEDGNLWGEAISGRHGQIIPFCQMLLAAGLHVNAPLKIYGSALIRAIYYQNAELVQLLLDHGADITVVDPLTGYSAYHLAVHLLDQPISQLLATKLQQQGLPIPSYQTAPAIEDVKQALTTEHDDLIQLSLYATSDDDPAKKFRTLQQLLGYARDTLPFTIYVPDGDENWEDDWEDYAAPLSCYRVVYHPNDLRQFLLVTEWYDEYAYITIYHLHIRCKRSNTDDVIQLLQQWEQEGVEDRYKDEEFEQDYRLGIYEKDSEAIAEAEEYYLDATRAIAKKFGNRG
jgi:ankyrin repeat protein